MSKLTDSAKGSICIKCQAPDAYAAQAPGGKISGRGRRSLCTG